jgi:uncharacterized protein (TIGR02996 family)
VSDPDRRGGDRADRLHGVQEHDETGVVRIEYADLVRLEVTEKTVAVAALRIARGNLAKSLPVLEALRAVVQTWRIEEQQPPPIADDIGSHPIAIELQAAIAATPDDAGPQLVLADFLLSSEDPRGELIMMDNLERSTPGGLTDPEALERYLLLAAEYSFPRSTPEEPTLAFTGYGANPATVETRYNDRTVALQYENRVLAMRVDNRTVQWRLRLERPDNWTPDELIVILRIVSDALCAGSPLHLLQFPFVRDPLPLYDAGPLRCYPLPPFFTKPRNISPLRYGLAARDFQRWIDVSRRLVKIEGQANQR